MRTVLINKNLVCIALWREQEVRMRKAMLLGIMIMIIALAGPAMAATMDINVRANVVGTCKVTTAGPLTVDFLDLSYDAAGSSNAAAQTTSFNYWCTNGAAYSYSSAGANDASCTTPPCMMNAGLTSEIPYSVTLNDTGSGTGSGPSNPDETISVQIDIAAGAADNAAVGLHTDTLTVTLAP